MGGRKGGGEEKRAMEGPPGGSGSQSAGGRLSLDWQAKREALGSRAAGAEEMSRFAEVAAGRVEIFGRQWRAGAVVSQSGSAYQHGEEFRRARRAERRPVRAGG